MKRPLFWVGTAYLWTLMLLAMTGERFAAAFAGTAGALFLLLTGFAVRRARNEGTKSYFFPVICFFCFLAALLFLVKTETEYKPAAALDGKTGHLEGYVTEVLTDSESGSHRCIIRAEIDGLAVPGRLKIRFSSKKYTPAVNDWISLNGTFYMPGGDDPDMRGYYKSHRTYLGVYTFESVSAVPLSEAPLSGAERQVRKAAGTVDALRRFILQTIRSYLPAPYNAVLSGMLIGDKSMMGNREKTAFRMAGVLPLFAVSGFHTALWAMLLYRMLLRSGVRRRFSCLLTMAFLVLFMALTGFSGSSVRAGLMLMVLFLGRMLVLQPDSLNSLGFAALVIALGNPFCGGDAGLLLSFFATLGILAVYPVLMNPVHRKLKQIGRYSLRSGTEKILSGLLISASTMVLTLPVVMLCFGGLSVVSPVSNLLVTGTASLAILLSGFGVLMQKIPVFMLLSRWAFLVSGLICRYILFVCRTLAKLPFAYLGMESGGVRLAVAAGLLLAAAAVLLQAGCAVPDRRMLARITALLCVIVLLSSVFSEQLLNRGRLTVTFASVGNGTLIVVCCNGSAAVIGCGGDYRAAGAVSDIMAENGAARLSALIVPRVGEGEASAFEKLIGQYSPQTIVVPKGLDVSAVTGGSRIKRTGTADIALFPEVSLKLRSDGASPAAVLKAGNLRALLIFRPAADPAALRTVFGEDAVSADLLYSRADVPVGLNCRGFSFIIVSENDGKQSAGTAGPDAEPILTTAPGGITVGCRGSRYHVRRRHL